MGIVISSWEKLFKKSLDFQLFKIYLVFLIIFALSYLAIVSVFFISGLILFIVFLGSFPVDLTQFGLIFFSAVSSPGFVFSAIVLLVLFVFFELYLVAIYSGMMLNISALFQSRKNKNVGVILREAFHRTTPRVWTLIKTNVLIGLILFVPLLIILSFTVFPAIFTISSNPLSGLGVLFALIVFLFIWFGLLFFIMPFLLLQSSIPLFEKKGAIDSIKRIWVLGKQNYGTNFGFGIVLGLTVFIIVMVFSLFVGVLFTPLNFVVLPFGFNGTGNIFQNFSFLFFVIFLRVCVNVLLQAWVLSFTSLMIVRVFEVNTKKINSKISQQFSKEGPVPTDEQVFGEQSGYFERPSNTMKVSD